MQPARMRCAGPWSFAPVVPCLGCHFMPEALAVSVSALNISGETMVALSMKDIAGPWLIFVTKPTFLTSGISFAVVPSSTITTSGATLYAAAYIPRRPTSSCTVNTP